MRTISDTVIILSGELFVTGCQEKANKCVFVAEKLSAPRQLWKTHNNSFGKVCKYINHLPLAKSSDPVSKSSKRTMFSVLDKTGVIRLKKLHTLHLFPNSTFLL